MRATDARLAKKKSADLIVRCFTESPAFGTNALQISIHNLLLTPHFHFAFPPGVPEALTRAAWEGSTPIVTLTVMPGLSAAMVALCPFTAISVNCVIVNARAVFSSVTVIVFAVTLDITGA